MTTPSVSSEVGPFAMVPAWVCRYSLSGAELSVYIALRSFSGARLGSDERQAVFPHVATVAERAHVATRTAERAITKLRDLGLLTSSRRHDSRGYVRGCDYVFLDLDPNPIKGLTDETDGALTDHLAGGVPTTSSEQEETTDLSTNEGPTGCPPGGARADAQAAPLKGRHLEDAEPAELTRRLVAVWAAVVKEHGALNPQHEPGGWDVDGSSLPRGHHPIGQQVKAWAESGPHTAAEIDRALDQIRTHAREWATA